MFLWLCFTFQSNKLGVVDVGATAACDNALLLFCSFFLLRHFPSHDTKATLVILVRQGFSHRLRRLRRRQSTTTTTTAAAAVAAAHAPVHFVSHLKEPQKLRACHRTVCDAALARRRSSQHRRRVFLPPPLQRASRRRPLAAGRSSRPDRRELQARGRRQRRRLVVCAHRYPLAHHRTRRRHRLVLAGGRPRLARPPWTAAAAAATVAHFGDGVDGLVGTEGGRGVFVCAPQVPPTRKRA